MAQILALLAATHGFVAPSSVSRSVFATRLNGMSVEMALPKTVDEAKKRFYGRIGRALPMATAAFANEMIQSTTFAMVAPTWKYSRIYALGNEFLYGGQSTDEEATVVREALILAFGYETATVLGDAEALREEAKGKSEDELFAMADLAELDGKATKYTYTFGAGLVALMKLAELEPKEAIPKWCEKLELNCVNALGRDFDYYASSVEKMDQMKDLMVQMKASADRGRAEREAAKAQKEKE